MKKGKVDTKLQIAAICVWWLVFFIVLITIAVMFSPFIANFRHDIIRTVVVCAILAVIFDFISYTLIFPNIIKEQKGYKIILHEMSVYGMSEQLKNYIVEQYNICAKKPDTNYMYITYYASLIAAYYSDTEDWASAYKYLDSVDCSKFQKDLKYPSIRERIMSYYLTKLYIECEACDKERADSTYHTIMRFSANCGYEEELRKLDTAEVIFGSYGVLCGHYQSVIDRLDTVIYDDDSLMAAKFAVMADAYTRLGNIEKAFSMLEQALNYLKFEFDKDVINRKIDKLKVLKS